MSVDGGGGGETNPSFYETMTTGVTDEDEAMQLALAMSMAGGGGEGDEDVIKDVMGELGVDEDEVRKEMEEEEEDDKKK